MVLLTVLGFMNLFLVVILHKKEADRYYRIAERMGELESSFVTANFFMQQASTKTTTKSTKEQKPVPVSTKRKYVRSGKYSKRLDYKVPVKLVNKTMSEGLRRHWASLTPEQKKIKISAMTKGREIAKAIKVAQNTMQYRESTPK